MARYLPESIPDFPEVQGLAEFLSRELRRIGGEVGLASEITLDTRHTPPAKPRDGMIVYADGTDWNPGQGAGFYGRMNAQWILLGSTTATLTLTSGSLTLSGKALILS